MSKIKIFVEGKSDKYIIKHLCSLLHIDLAPEEKNLISVGGFTKIIDQHPKFEEAKNNSQKILIIFDSDQDGIDNGGYKDRKKYLLNVIYGMGLDLLEGTHFNIYLFPNQKDAGEYENLLESIINTKHRVKLNCFQSFEKCIEDNNSEGIYESPDIKAKMYSYIKTFKMSNSKEKYLGTGDWDFNNQEYWNFDSEYLQPLKNFLIDNSK
jgi:predicted ATP-dependent endonuclease of OLD family